MRTRVAHAPRFAKTSCTRRTALSVNPQFTTYKPKNSVQTTGATAGKDAPIVLRGHKGKLTTARFSPYGEQVVTASEDASTKIWRSDGSGLPAVLRGYQDSWD